MKWRGMEGRTGQGRDGVERVVEGEHRVGATGREGSEVKGGKRRRGGRKEGREEEEGRRGGRRRRREGSRARALA